MVVEWLVPGLKTYNPLRGNEKLCFSLERRAFSSIPPNFIPQKQKKTFIFVSFVEWNEINGIKIYYNSTGLMQMVTHLLSKSGII